MYQDIVWKQRLPETKRVKEASDLSSETEVDKVVCRQSTILRVTPGISPKFCELPPGFLRTTPGILRITPGIYFVELLLCRPAPRLKYGLVTATGMAAFLVIDLPPAGESAQKRTKWR